MEYAGIDIGSTGIKIVVLDDQAKVRKVYPYKRHFGNVVKNIEDGLEKIVNDFGSVHITLTGKIGEFIARENSIDYENEVLCVQSALNHLVARVGMIIDIGGQHVKFMSVSNGNGDMMISGDIKMNSSCAAGTGAFMDQQAERLYGTDADSQGCLSLDDRADFVLKKFIDAANSCDKPAKIAGRCSVFAKSDMIHNQQVGVPPEEVSYGLVLGFVRNLYGTVASKMQLKEPVVLIGGVAGNIVVKKAMEHEFKLTQPIKIPEHFEFIPAIGAALRSIGKKNYAPRKIKHVSMNNRSSKKNPKSILKPLRIKLSKIGSNKIDKPYENAANQKVYMGIDVGSVSTNIALVDADTERIVTRHYGRTMGKPIEAIKNGLKEIYRTMGSDRTIVGVGTTGSGRKLAGVLVGADVVKNEITAHAMGVYRTDPEIDTIFEIGGQDSKYIHTQGGVPVDFEMNKVCAAGTGSFLEEQGNRLGIDIKEEFARLALSSDHPVRLGDRCTVFMESSVVAEQQKNTCIEDILAGLAYSTVFNYLHKVVGRKKIGKKISFQGGTALNRAVVAAFERVLETTITVPDHMDILGAVGIAHYAKESYRKGD